MHSYAESLSAAKKIIEASALSAEDKAFLNELVPKLAPDMLDVFLWTLEDNPGDISSLVRKTRALVASQGDAAELQKAIEEDKKALEAAIQAEELLEA
ncbi:MAG: hypothetical protein HYT94_05445 [Parcubacteria group bacterium]|nr:hypothetical protein [Parcubacteria group bacterium]